MLLVLIYAVMAGGGVVTVLIGGYGRGVYR